MKNWSNNLQVINLSGYNPDAKSDMGTSVENNFFETSAPKGNLSDSIKNGTIIIEETYIDLGEIYSPEIYFMSEVLFKENES